MITSMVALLAPISIISGCTTVPSSPAVLIKLDESTQSVKVVDFPSERRAGWVAPQKDGSIKICSEPPSDVGLNVSQLLSLAAEINKADIGVGGSVDSSIITSIVELKGRTPAVLALRDVMYRMCEARVAGNSLTSDEIKIYDRIVSVISDFAKADLANVHEKQEKVNRQQSGDLALARQTETWRAQALEKSQWALAQKAFEESEGAFNGYGWSYEYARALKSGGTDKQQAQRILNIKGRMPFSTKESLEHVVK